MRSELLEFLDNAGNFEVRGMRLLLEYFYANDRFRALNGNNLRGISVFGSARIKEDDPVYQIARETGRLLYGSGYSVITGAASGVMEAANRGVADGVLEKLSSDLKEQNIDLLKETEQYKKEMEKHSIGLKITLPFEKDVNDYLGTWVSFHYFAIRKLFFAMLSEGFIRCEGGWGTRDEFWEVATLVQTGKMPLMPIVVLQGKEARQLQQEIEMSIEQGYISDTDRHLVDFVETPAEAVQIMNHFYKNVKSINYTRNWEIEIFLSHSVPEKNRQKVNRYHEQNPGLLEDVLFSDEKVLIRGFTFRSYGHLRKLIDAINE